MMTNPKERKKLSVPTREPGKKTKPAAFDNVRKVAESVREDHPLMELYRDSQSQQNATGYPDSHVSAQDSQLSEVAIKLSGSDSHISEPDSLIAKTEGRESQSDIRVSLYPDILLSDQSALSSATQYEYSWKSRTGKVQLNTRIPEGLYDEVLEVAALLSADMKEIVTEALCDIVLKYTGKRISGYPDSQLSAYPQATLKELSKLEIINLYSQISKKPVGIRDRKLIDKALKAFHPLLVEFGMRKADIAARESGGLVYSFNYCMNQISLYTEWDLASVAKELAALR